VFRTRHEVEQLEATIEELRAALADGWQRRKALEEQVESLRGEIAELRAALDQAPTALAAEREALRRQIEDLLGVKALVTEQLSAALNRLQANGESETRVTSKAGGRVHADDDSLDRVVDTTVQVAVAPLLDFVSVSALERALETVPQVSGARVRRLEGERAIVQVELREAGPLLRWVDGVLPFDVDASVVESDCVALAVR
jgi:chromosome segregation ATPase